MTITCSLVFKHSSSHIWYYQLIIPVSCVICHHVNCLIIN